MIDPELVAKIRLLFFAEHWKTGSIATQLNLHRDTVRAALETDRFNRPKQERTSCKTDPYVDFIRQTLAQYPRLSSTRIFQMIRARGYEGGSSQLRRLVARLRPVVQEPFLQLQTFPGEQGQAAWADFGEVRIGQARRRLSCFVITLSYSRALALNFFFDQSLENLLRAHVEAFQLFQASPGRKYQDEMVWLAWVQAWHVSNLYELGADEKVVQRILRHAKSHVTKDRYIKAFDPAGLAPMRKLETSLGAIGQSAPTVHRIN